MYTLRILGFCCVLVLSTQCRSGGNENGDLPGKLGGNIEIDGIWEGSGKVGINGQVDNCDNVKFEFEQSDRYFKVVEVLYSCENETSFYWDPVEFEIVGSRLVTQGHTAGRISAEEIIIEGNEPGFEFKKTIKFDDDGSLTISEHYSIDGLGEFENSAILAKE